MRRLIAFSVGVATLVAGRSLVQEAPGDPLPGRRDVREAVRQLGHEAPPQQKAAFADGRIDAVEYRQAVWARLDCLRARVDRPLEIHGPDTLAGGRLLTWRYRVDGDPDPRVTEADHLCARDLSASIERAWRLEAVPQGQARTREVAKLAACLRDHSGSQMGRGIEAVLTGAVLAGSSVGECVDRHAVLFDL